MYSNTVEQSFKVLLKRVPDSLKANKYDKESTREPEPLLSLKDCLPYYNMCMHSLYHVFSAKVGISHVAVLY